MLRRIGFRPDELAFVLQYGAGAEVEDRPTSRPDDRLCATASAASASGPSLRLQ